MTPDSDEFPLWIIPLFPVAFVLFWCAICYALAFISGWRRLAAIYEANGPTEGDRFLFRGGKIGSIGYNGVLHFAVARQGLFIWLFFPFRLGSPRLLIPWRDISASTQKGWMFDWVVLSFRREPGASMRLIRQLAEDISAASNGQLRIGAR